MSETIRVDAGEMESVLNRLMLQYGAGELNARAAASIFTLNSADGVPSHGLNRVLRTLEYIEAGHINPGASCSVMSSGQANMVLDGNLGLGMVNAALAIDKACELAGQFGIGVVSLHNTNHWMRGGAYGWQAANRGFLAICWSNTCPNMVPWGGERAVIGNNPLVLAAPRGDGRHVVLDSAMSQFSYGRMQAAAEAGERLPFPGGWSAEGELTDDPAEVMDTFKAVPMGYWKGSGLAILLDLIGGLAAGGNTTSDVGRKYQAEMGLTQVMIAIKPQLAGAAADALVEQVLADVAGSGADGQVRYPGQREYAARQESARQGILADRDVWEAVLAKLRPE